MLYPKERIESKLKSNKSLMKEIWQALSQISPDDLLSSGRVYGGGLYKLEPSELGSVPGDSIARIIESQLA
jgi:hypothetical protein